MADIDKHQVLVKKNLNSIANEVYSQIFNANKQREHFVRVCSDCSLFIENPKL